MDPGTTWEQILDETSSGARARKPRSTNGVIWRLRCLNVTLASFEFGNVAFRIRTWIAVIPPAVMQIDRFGEYCKCFHEFRGWQLIEGLGLSGARSQGEFVGREEVSARPDW